MRPLLHLTDNLIFIIMSEDNVEFESVKDKLHGETARINWQDLQRFFAQGAVLHVSSNLDLIEIAVLFAEDNAEQLEPLLESLEIRQPSNDQARNWYANNVELWSVVVAPYVLVQEQTSDGKK